MTGIIMDGITYDVRVVYGSLARSFALIEGTNAGTSLTNASIRDLVGTAYTYSLQVEPNPANVAAYDAFFAAISAPIDAHIFCWKVPRSSIETTNSPLLAQSIFMRIPYPPMHPRLLKSRSFAQGRGSRAKKRLTILSLFRVSAPTKWGIPCGISTFVHRSAHSAAA